MSFLFYRTLEQDEILKAVNKLLEEESNDDLYQDTLGRLLQKSYEANLKEDLYKMYITYLVARDENPFSLAAEKDGEDIDGTLLELAIKDMATILDLFNKPLFNVRLVPNKEANFLKPLYDYLSSNPSPEEATYYLAQYYKRFGAGEMNHYKAFKWDPSVGLVGISECDPIVLDDLVACDYQKTELIKNTENFLAGKAANNALLSGDRGTGKSSSVKALLNAYSDQGLRILELSKADFIHFNKILKVLRPRGLKFILFLDDLSFEEFEVEYKYMKALIEGGIEVKPKNVLIYATSNRRHLIRETWEERQGQDINVRDTRQEKLSLADRFGLTLTFTSPDQKTYLDMVRSIAKAYHITLEEKILCEKALQWELSHGGRSGRVAKQFIQSLL